jgi:starch phosphorylase
MLTARCRAVEDLRYQHTYHPVPIEEKCPALANVLNQISAGLFDDANVYEPLLNTIRQGDYYLLSDDFDSCACPSTVYPVKY